MPDVFISYKKERRHIAGHLASILEAYGYSSWFDYNLLPGADFGRQLEVELRAAKVAIVLWCSLSARSHWVLEEAHLAKALGKILPAWIEKVDPPLGYLTLETIDLSCWDGNPRSPLLDRLMSDISRRVQRETIIDYDLLRGCDKYYQTMNGLPLLSDCTPPAAEPEQTIKGELIDRRRIAIGPRTHTREFWASTTSEFSDIQTSPKMVLLPAGRFLMGSSDNEVGHEPNETPLHPVNITTPIAISKTAITLSQYEEFVESTGRSIPRGAHLWTVDGNWKYDKLASYKDPGYSTQPGLPVTCVNWDDAVAFAEWLHGLTGYRYRLLSEAEWEYAARADTLTPFWWGDEITRDNARFTFHTDTDAPFGPCNAGAHPPNPWGLHILGNVAEWCADPWNVDYEHDRPQPSSPRKTGDNTTRVIRGGSWRSGPKHLRTASRSREEKDIRDNSIGFRVAREITFT
jgi:formylglycine-generating enzyme required for sulfatase activity